MLYQIVRKLKTIFLVKFKILTLKRAFAIYRFLEKLI